jgi:hypothetical protein
MTRGYENKASIISLHLEEGEILTVQERDGNLKPMQDNFLHPDVKMIMMMTSKTLLTYICILLETDARFISTSSCEVSETRSPAPSHRRQTMMVSDHWNRCNTNIR